MYSVESEGLMQLRTGINVKKPNPYTNEVWIPKDMQSKVEKMY
jgi:hypothetical protein